MPPLPTANKNLLSFGALLALGMVLSALILGYAAQKAGGAKQSITVKGVAEQPVTATHARWSITVYGGGDSPAQAFADLRRTQATVVRFLTNQQKFSGKQINKGLETYETIYKKDEEGRTTDIVDRYRAKQVLTVSSDNVRQIDTAARSIVRLDEQGLPINADNPEYLVGNLDDVKMALIAAATENANKRAEEFAKTGKANLGVIKSATQGTFNILSAQGGGEEGDDYGGSYDKSSIDKIVRVVVTVEYGLSQ